MYVILSHISFPLQHLFWYNSFLTLCLYRPWWQFACFSAMNLPRMKYRNGKKKKRWLRRTKRENSLVHTSKMRQSLSCRYVSCSLNTFQLNLITEGSPLLPVKKAPPPQRKQKQVSPCSAWLLPALVLFN